MQLPALVPALPDAPTLARAVLDQPSVQLSEVASFLGAPAVELEASVVSARIAIAAANEGRCFVHHEHRLSPLLPAEAHPEIDVGLGEEVVPEDWQSGVLHVPKYFSAFLEAPLPVFHPSHRAKWRPHELLHKLARFAWRPDITRFEAYLTARLSELLPVVHWYGFDEIGRHACPEHRGVRPSRTHCDRCERDLVPYWQSGSGPEHAEAAASHALEHLRTELDACAKELQSGRCVSTPRAGLDASSDAVGYLRGHWNRTTAWSFGAWAERFTAAGAERFESCAEHLEHVRRLADALLTEPHALAAESVRLAARDRHGASDLGYRLLLHVEALDSDAAEDALVPLVDALAEGRQVTELVCEIEERLRSLDPATADRPLAGGWSWLPPSAGAQTSLQAGLRTALPRALEDLPLEDLILDFATSDCRPRPASLALRFCEHLDATGHPGAEAARLEAWLQETPATDLEADRFAALPDDGLEEGRVRLNATLRRCTVSRAALDTVLGDASEGAEETSVIAIRWRGEPRVLEASVPVVDALEQAAAGLLRGSEVARDLLEQGFVIWFPTVR